MGKNFLYSALLPILLAAQSPACYQYEETQVGEKIEANLENLTAFTFTNLKNDFTINITSEQALDSFNQEIEGWFNFYFSTDLIIGITPQGEDLIQEFTHQGIYTFDENEHDILAYVQRPPGWLLIPLNERRKFSALIGELEILLYGDTFGELISEHDKCTESNYQDIIRSCKGREIPCYTIRSTDQEYQIFEMIVPRGERRQLIRNNC